MRKLLGNRWVRNVIYWIPPVVLFNTEVASLRNVHGRSMQPTFNPDSSLVSDVVLLDRYCVSGFFQQYSNLLGNWAPQGIRRGDVVVLKSPLNPKHRIIKRVIATEFDSVKTLPPHPESIIEVPEGHIWVEGDEPFHSRDSNYFGPVSKGLVEGKIRHIVWPLTRAGTVEASPREATTKGRVLSSTVLYVKS